MQPRSRSTSEDDAFTIQWILTFIVKFIGRCATMDWASTAFECRGPSASFMFVVHVCSTLAIRAVATFRRRSDEAFSASWLLMLDLPLFDRPSSAGMSVKAQSGRRGTHHLCTTRSSATVGSTSVMATAIESQLRVGARAPLLTSLNQF